MTGVGVCRSGWRLAGCRPLADPAERPGHAVLQGGMGAKQENGAGALGRMGTWGRGGRAGGKNRGPA